MLRDLRRLKPETIELWNGEKWTQLKGIVKTKRIGNEIELVLRSGERISCTPTHQFPTDRGLLQASDIRLGDKLHRVMLPGPDKPRDCALDSDAAWLAGLYLAEGSMADDCIQIAGHSKETERWERCQQIATKYGGYATHTVNGNIMNIRLYGKVLRAILSEFVSGHIAKNKALAPVVWRYSDSFV